MCLDCVKSRVEPLKPREHSRHMVCNLSLWGGWEWVIGFYGFFSLHAQRRRRRLIPKPARETLIIRSRGCYRLYLSPPFFNKYKYSMTGSWDLHAYCGTPECVLFLCCSISNVQGGVESSKGAVWAQKALQGSDTETRKLLDGKKENRQDDELIIKNHWFFLKAN